MIYDHAGGHQGEQYAPIKPAAGGSVEAGVEDNHARITTQKHDQLILHLDSRLVDYDKPVHVLLNGQEQVLHVQPRLATLCESVCERVDPELAFACRVALPTAQK